MASFSLPCDYVVVNGINLTGHTGVTLLEISSDPLSMSGSMTIARSDGNLGGVSDMLWTLLGQVVPFEARPEASAVSATNPQYAGLVLISHWTDLNCRGYVTNLSVVRPSVHGGEWEKLGPPKADSVQSKAAGFVVGWGLEDGSPKQTTPYAQHERHLIAIRHLAPDARIFALTPITAGSGTHG